MLRVSLLLGGLGIAARGFDGRRRGPKPADDLAGLQGNWKPLQCEYQGVPQMPTEVMKQVTGVFDKSEYYLYFVDKGSDGQPKVLRLALAKVALDRAPARSRSPSSSPTGRSRGRSATASTNWPAINSSSATGRREAQAERVQGRRPAAATSWRRGHGRSEMTRPFSRERGVARLPRSTASRLALAYNALAREPRCCRGCPAGMTTAVRRRTRHHGRSHAGSARVRQGPRAAGRLRRVVAGHGTGPADRAVHRRGRDPPANCALITRDGRRPSASGRPRRSAGCTMCACSPAGPPSAPCSPPSNSSKSADTLTCTGEMYRYRMRLAEHLTGLIELLAGSRTSARSPRRSAAASTAAATCSTWPAATSPRSARSSIDLDEKVKAEIRRLLRDPELRRILRYPNATVHGDHYVLPVAVNHRHKVPGVVHRTSSTGETVFIEPAERRQAQRRAGDLKGEEDREVKRVLRRLSGEVGRVAKPLVLRARGDGEARPDHRQGPLQPRLRHVCPGHQHRGPALAPQGPPSAAGTSLPQPNPPLSSHQSSSHPSSSPRAVVPIDVRLGIGFNLLVITGPNTGGKTVTLKTTGLLCLMAQSGMHIPAGEGSLVPVFRHILADIGDEQSLEQSLSTFSSHISRIASIFESRRRRQPGAARRTRGRHRPDRGRGAGPGDPR